MSDRLPTHATDFWCWTLDDPMDEWRRGPFATVAEAYGALSQAPYPGRYQVVERNIVDYGASQRSTIHTIINVAVGRKLPREWDLDILGVPRWPAPQYGRDAADD